MIFHLKIRKGNKIFILAISAAYCKSWYAFSFSSPQNSFKVDRCNRSIIFYVILYKVDMLFTVRYDLFKPTNLVFLTCVYGNCWKTYKSLAIKGFICFWYTLLDTTMMKFHTLPDDAKWPIICWIFVWLFLFKYKVGWSKINIVENREFVTSTFVTYSLRKKVGFCRL